MNRTHVYLASALCFLSLFIHADIVTFESAIQDRAPVIEEEPTFSMNFEKASLKSVVEYLTEQKKVDYIPHKDLGNIKVSLSSNKPLTLSQAWDTLYTLLEANGFTMIKVNGKYQVISMKDHQRSPLPCFSSSQGVEPADLPDTDEVGRYIYFCRNIKAGAAKSILNDMLSQGAVQVNNTLEACIITDKMLLIKSAMKIVTELDKGGLREAIKVIQLTHARAEDVTKIFSQITNDKDKKSKIRFSSTESKKAMYFSNDTKIIPETNKNKLILMGTAQNIDKVIDFIHKYLDIPVESTESRIHIKEIKYKAAEKVKRLLEKMIKAPSSSKSLVEGEFKYFEDVIIAAETPRDSVAGSGESAGKGSGNRLIISCNKKDWSRLNTFIDALDKPQPQVALEIMIVDLKVDDERSLGAQVRTKANMLGEDIAAQAANIASYTGAIDGDLIQVASGLGSPSSILTLGRPGDIWGVIRSVYKIDHSNIISQPYLVTNNNTPCREEIVLQRYVPGGLAGGGSGSLSLSTREDIPVRAAISTEITPRINASGIIDLDINISVNEFQQNIADSPDRTDRKIQTRALMGSGEVLVIGGLTNNKKATSEWSVPLLSRIPLLGNLFKDNTAADLKKHLYIFIRASVLKPHFEGTPDDYTQFKLDYAKYQVLKNDPYKGTNDPIQRWFFKPEGKTVAEHMRHVKEGRVPTLDDFVEGKTNPIQVRISKDPFFRVKGGISAGVAGQFRSFDDDYNPQDHDMEMPNLDPTTYQTPGLIEASLSHEELSLAAESLAKGPRITPQTTVIPSATTLAHLQRRKGTIS